MPFKPKFDLEEQLKRDWYFNLSNIFTNDIISYLPQTIKLFLKWLIMSWVYEIEWTYLKKVGEELPKNLLKQPAASKPIEKIVEKIVYVDKIVEKIVEKPGLTKPVKESSWEKDYRKESQLRIEAETKLMQFENLPRKIEQLEEENDKLTKLKDSAQREAGIKSNFISEQNFTLLREKYIQDNKIDTITYIKEE